MSFSVLLAIAIALGIGLWLRQRSQGGGRRTPRLAAKRGTGVQTQTRRQLLRLVGGNRSVADRLVLQVQQRYPGRPEQWHWEKAIYDIQRDRRS